MTEDLLMVIPRAVEESLKLSQDALKAAHTLERFSLILPPVFCHSQALMRLLIEILVIAALIFFGWQTPFKERADRAKERITSALDSMGGTLQKHQDSSVRRYESRERH